MFEAFCLSSNAVMETTLQEYGATNLSLFVVLFNDAVSSSDYVTLNDWLILNYRMRKEVGHNLF
jgi:hypothetical protein